MIQGRIRPMIAADLERVLAWRNHPDIARCMRQPEPISPQAHADWFARCQELDSRHLLIFETNAVPSGFVQLSIEQDIADWGFYTAPNAPRGTGRGLGRAALDHAFGPLGLAKVCGQVLATNPRSMRFHEALGFHREGVLRAQQNTPAGRVDLVCYGLLTSEWKDSAPES